jgi:hypothetical protein
LHSDLRKSIRPKSGGETQLLADHVGDFLADAISAMPA